MRLNRFVPVTVVGCAAVMLLAPSGLAGQTLQGTGYSTVMLLAMPGLAAQMPPGTGHAAMEKAKPQSGMAGDMAAKCQAMMADHEKMMTQMKAADQRLDDLVGKMNAASGMQKADATAAVVNEMVIQRRTMKDGMMKDQQQMMAHMMEHMQAGKDSMAMCPMMKH
jgi:hypothetical protein